MREDRDVDTADVPFTAADLAAALAWEARRDAVTVRWRDIAARIEAEAKRRYEESIKAQEQEKKAVMAADPTAARRARCAAVNGGAPSTTRRTCS